MIWPVSWRLQHLLQRSALLPLVLSSAWRYWREVEHVVAQNLLCMDVMIVAITLVSLKSRASQSPLLSQPSPPPSHHSQGPALWQVTTSRTTRIEQGYPTMLQRVVRQECPYHSALRAVSRGAQSSFQGALRGVLVSHRPWSSLRTMKDSPPDTCTPAGCVCRVPHLESAVGHSHDVGFLFK